MAEKMHLVVHQRVRDQTVLPPIPGSFLIMVGDDVGAIL